MTKINLWLVAIAPLCLFGFLSVWFGLDGDIKLLASMGWLVATLNTLGAGITISELMR